MLTLTGCQNLAKMLETKPTVQAVVDGIRKGCSYEASSTDIQALLNSGIPGLSTVGNYVGAFCGAVAALPVSTARASVAGLPPMAVRIGPVAVHAQPVVK